jgi:transposase-like protein
MARKEQGIGIVLGWQEGLGGEDFLRDLVQRTVQQVLEAEMTSFLGAEAYQRNDVRRGWRNGYKPRTLKTRVGELELMVPKDRDGQFQTELFERYQRSEKALVLALLQMYVEGVSTRKVTAITEALSTPRTKTYPWGPRLCGLEVSKSQVSVLTAKLDAEVTESATREAAQAALAAAIAELVKKAPKVARLLEEHGEEILGVYALPEAHQKRMRTTNMLERQNQELKRRTRVVRVFPHEQSCLRLIAALLMETNQEWMGRIYLRMEEESGAEIESQAQAA